MKNSANSTKNNILQSTEFTVQYRGNMKEKKYIYNPPRSETLLLARRFTLNPNISTTFPGNATRPQFQTRELLCVSYPRSVMGNEEIAFNSRRKVQTEERATKVSLLPLGL